MKNILVIEDKKENLEEAKKYFEKIKPTEKINVFYAEDYKNALKILEKEKIDGIISDIFFPEETGSGKVDLGKEIYNKIAKTFDYEPLPNNQLLKKIEDHIGKEWELKTNYYLTLYELVSLNDYPEKLDEALKELSSLKKSCSKEQFELVAPMIAQQHSHPILRSVAKKLKRKGVKEEMGIKMARSEEYGALLLGYILEGENNQPLGILIAERAKEKNIPLVFITSLHAAHDSAATPVCEYLKKEGIRVEVIESGGYGLNVKKQDIGEENKFLKKESDWKLAYSRLKRLMEK